MYVCIYTAYALDEIIDRYIMIYAYGCDLLFTTDSF